jgi:DNA repair protein RadD
MAGRGLRPAEGKINLILIDHSGAVYRHGLLEDRVEWTLDVTKRAQNPTHEIRSRTQTSRLIECSQCGALRKGGEACPACGFLPKRRPDAIVFRDGELARVDRNTRQPVQSSDPHERMRWLAMLYFIEQTKPYRRNWARCNYKEKFGTWPLYGELKPMEPSPEVRAWVRSRQIAYAKAMQKRSQS